MALPLEFFKKPLHTTATYQNFPARPSNLRRVQTRINPISTAEAPSSPPLFEWRTITSESIRELEPLKMTLRGQRVDAESTEIGTFVQFTEEELEERRIRVVEGRLYLGTSDSPLTTSPGKMIFVMTKDRKADQDIIEIYAATPQERAVFHSSFSKNPIAPGTFHCVNGIPDYFDEESGHFAPQGRVQYVVAELGLRGCILPDSLKIKPSRYRVVSPEERVSDHLNTRVQRLQEILSAKSPADKKSPPSNSPHPKIAERSSPLQVQRRTFTATPSLLSSESLAPSAIAMRRKAVQIYSQRKLKTAD